MLTYQCVNVFADMEHADFSEFFIIKNNDYSDKLGSNIFFYVVFVEI